MAFVHGAALWLRNLVDETTFDLNFRVSAFSKSFGSDYNRITVELANNQASVVIFISTCGDIFRKSLSKDQVVEFDSVAMVDVDAGEACFPMFCFTSERRFPIENLKQNTTSSVCVVAFAGSNDCCSGTRLVEECFSTCRHALSYILDQLKFQEITGGFRALQSFCDSLVHNDCSEHRISASIVEKSIVVLKSTVQLPLTASFYKLAQVTFKELASAWISAKAVYQANKLDSKISFDCMPHPASLDALMKSLSEHASGFSSQKKISGMILNALAEGSNKQLHIAQKQDCHPSSHTMIRRKSVGSISTSLLSTGHATSTSEKDRRSSVARGRGRSTISGMAGVDLSELKRSSAKNFQKQIITTQARTSIELTRGLTSKNAPKPRILHEQRCALDGFGQDSAYLDHHHISSAVISCSQNILAMTIGSCLHCVEIIRGKQLFTKMILQKDMSDNLLIVQNCEYADTLCLMLNNGRLACIKKYVCSQDFKTDYAFEFTEFETYIDNCNFCSLLVHNDWLNICGSEGSQNVEYIRFKLESGNVIEKSGHGLPLGLSTSVTAIQFHLIDPKSLSPFILCGLCNSDVEMWGKVGDGDLYLMQCLRNRTSGLGAINSICSMGKDTIAVGHDGGYVNFWSIEISSKSASILDRQFSISPSADGLPRSFQTVSADKFSDDQHHFNSQLVVINEHCGDSAVLHAETGVLLHCFSLPLIPPHILYHFSGQSSEFITLVEFSILCVQDACLQHLKFQLLYVSYDQTPIPKNLAVLPGSQRSTCQAQVNGNTAGNRCKQSVDQLDGALLEQVDTNAARRARSLHNFESLDGASRESEESIARQFEPPDACDTQDGCNFMEAPLCQQSLAESQEKSSIQPKASGIMNQILFRRSSQEIRDNVTSRILSGSTETLGSVHGDNDANVASLWRTLRPSILLPTKFDLQLQQESPAKVHDDMHSESSQQNHRRLVPQTLLETMSQERDEPSMLASLTSCPQPQLTRATFRSTLPRKLLSSTRVQATQLQNAPNRQEHVKDYRSDQRTLFSAFAMENMKVANANQNDAIHGRRPNPLLIQSDIAAAKSRDFQLSLATSPTTCAQHEYDSISGVMPTRPNPLLGEDRQFSSSGFNDYQNIHKKPATSRLPKRLQ